MNERYSIMFSQEKNLYAPGLPVIVEAGQLLKDNEVERILVQLKLLNITDKTIIAVKLLITGTDSFGKVVEKQDFQMLDLQAKRDEHFGQKIPLVLNNNTVRSFTTQVIEVVYSDGTNTVLPSASLTPLEEVKTLKAYLENKELVQQYGIDNKGNDCLYVPQNMSDLWVCTCGKFNHEKESACHACKRERKNVFRTLDKRMLTAEATLRNKTMLYKSAQQLLAKENLESVVRAQKIFERLNGFKDSSAMLETCNEKIVQLKKEEEQKAAEAAERAKKAREERLAKEKRKKKIIIIAASVAIVCALGISGISVIVEQQSEQQYNRGVELLGSGKYEEAAEVFEKLDDYRGSQLKKERAKYLQGVKLQIAGAYEEAVKIFEQLGEYEDSTLRLKYCKAGALVNAQNFSEAIEIYKELGSFEDSEHKLSEIYRSALYQESVQAE
ncbi:MAG: hypothetical protein NC293_12285 [Roseburia sp.]|nr:hypothetical protein [Roseburia sp.]